MKKIIFLLFASAIFLTAGQVSAMQVYVAIKIESAKDSSQADFCLPAGTLISVLDAGSQVGGTKSLESQACQGQTVYSNLVDLVPGRAYTARFSVPSCSGAYDNRSGYCWFKGDYGQNCTDVCSTRGGTLSTTCTEADPDCVILQTLGSYCYGCYSDSAVYDYMGYCFSGGYVGDFCGYQPMGQRLCACRTATGGEYDFNFTP